MPIPNPNTNLVCRSVIIPTGGKYAINFRAPRGLLYYDFMRSEIVLNKHLWMYHVDPKLFMHVDYRNSYISDYNTESAQPLSPPQRGNKIWLNRPHFPLVPSSKCLELILDERWDKIWVALVVPGVQYVQHGPEVIP